MGGYDLDEYEDYEDEGEYQEDDVGEYEEEEEEEDRLPTQEESQYLELRQKLKETIRKKMKKDSGSGLANSQSKKKKMPYDNFGSFFGPSQPVIAQRVIQESKSLLENPHLAERASSKAKNVHPQQNRGGSSNPTGSRPPRKVDTWAKPQAKIQMLKSTRDYSFLLSDDAELPVPTKNPPKPVSAPRPEAHLSPRPQVNGVRKVINGREERRHVPSSNNQTRVRPPGQQSQRPNGGSSKMTSTSLDSRKQQLGSGPGRPSSGQKTAAMPSKMPPPKQKMNPPSVSRSNGHNHNHNQKPQVPSRPLPANNNNTHKRPLEQKRDDRDRYRGSQIQQRRDDNRDRPQLQQRRVDNRGYEQRRDDNRGSSNGHVVRKPVLSSKPQIKQQPARHPSSAQQQKERVQKRPSRPFDDDDEDDDNPINMIRNMFGYNPNKYRRHNDDDDSDMEAGFEDIMREENRSARIAAQEDEEELKKIEEEERRERMRKEAKRRKLSQR
ncbi:hypothetical protein LXL04_022478 [Taraxacum kok-saghyz]